VGPYLFLHGGNELIPQVAAEMGLKTMVGVWLDEDHEHNEIELNNAIAVAQAGTCRPARRRQRGAAA
jgi:hypothetical protein